MKEKKPKKVKDGLIPDKDLNVVTSAGFKMGKRERSTNRRAGLHDKKKNLTGEKRVYRRKPLALKHKRRMRKAAAALSAVFVGCVAFVGYGFIFKKPVAPLGDGGYQTVCYELPADGAKPTSHTAVECVGYMNYALKSQQSWSSEFHATVNAMGLMSQSVSTYKEYYDNVLISADLTTSSMVNNARQFCVADGRVIWREASGGKNTYAAMDTPWSEKLAGNYSLAEFKDKRGFPPTEFSVYVINEKTVLQEGTSEYAVDNGDGTYSVTLHLNCASPEPGNEAVNETSAVYYYVRQMVVTGGLSDYPVFKDVQIKYTFDENWRVLSSEVSEDYAAVMGISANCTSDSLTEYRYDTADKAKSTVEKYYNGFFKQHIGTVVNPDDSGVTSAACLSNAFGSVLTEGAIFNVGVKIDGLDLSGTVSLDMNNGAIGDVRVKFGDVAAYYGVYGGKNTLFLSVGGSKIKLYIDDLLSGSTEGGAEGGILDGLDTDALLEQLGGGDFKVNDAGTQATLTSQIDIFGLKITLVFTFNVDGKNISLDDLKATIPLGEKVINATLAFGTEEDKPAALTESETAAYIDVLNDGFTVSGKADLGVGNAALSLDIKELSLKLKDGVSFKLGAQLKAADRIFDIYIAYADGKITAVYGDSNNNLGVNLDIANGDLQTLSTVIEDVIARIRDVIDEIIVTDASADKGELSQLENELLAADGLTNVLSEVLGILGIPKDEDGNIDILGLINSINITTVDGKAVIGVGENLALTLGIGQNDISLGVGIEISNASATFALNNLHLNSYTDVTCPVAADSILTVNDLAEMLDYVAAAAELLVEDEYSLSATASMFEDAGEGYKKTMDVKILFEYIKGEQFPVNVQLPKEDANGNKTPLGITLRDDMYWHLGVGLVRDYDNDTNYDITTDEQGNEVKTPKDELYIDVYILDANPAVGAEGDTKGKTTGLKQDGALGGGLDIYLSVSKYAVGAEGYAPLKVYAPVDEIVTILAAGAALLNLQGIDVSEESEALQGVIDTLADLIDDVLINKKLPYTKTQFSSLGESLLPQILGKDVSTFLKDILSSLSMTGEEEGADGETGENKPVNTEGNFISSVRLGVEEDTTSARYGDTKLSIALNSAAIYGAGYDNLVFNAYKANPVMASDGEEQPAEPTAAHSHITGAGINNIYYGGNKRVDVGLNVNREVVKLADYSGYYDFSGIDNLLNCIVNSITHEKANATDREKETAKGTLPDYILNHYYYINGTLTVGLNILNIVDTEINLKVVAASITIDEVTNDVGINVKISYDAVKAGAVGANYKVIDGACDVDLTIKDGMLYIKRTQTTQLGKPDGWSSALGALVSLSGYKVEGTNGKVETLAAPVVTYRVYPLSAMSTNVSDIMDLVSYVLNLNEKIVDIINSEINKTPTQDKEKVSYADYDIGKLVGSYLNYFQYSDDGEKTAKWDLELNGKFLTDFMGMTCSNPLISLKSSFTQDGEGNKQYVLENLSISNFNIELVKVGNGGISMSARGSFDYCNPQLNMRNDESGEKIVDITNNLSPLWEKLFGCDSKTLATAAGGLKEGVEYAPEVIAANKLWNDALAALSANSGKQPSDEKYQKYLEIDPSVSTGVDLGEVKYLLDGKACGADGKVLAEDESSGVYVLYNAERVLTEYAVPHLQERNGYEIVSEFNLATLTYIESYAAKTYNINIESAHEIIGAGATQEYTYGSDFDLSAYIGKTAQDGDLIYRLFAFELNGTEYNSVIPAAALAQIYGEEVTITAVWKEVYTVSLEFEGLPEAAAAEALEYANASAGYEDGKLYYENGGAAVSLIDLANVTGYDFVGYTLNGNSVNEIEGLTANATLTAVYKDVMLYLTLNCTEQFSYNGVEGASHDTDIIRSEDGSYSLSVATKATATQGTSYSLLGWFYKADGATEYSMFADKDGKIATDVAGIVGGDRVTVEAVWFKTNISGKGVRTGRSSLGGKYYYSIVGTVSTPVFVGASGAVKKFTYADASYTAYGYRPEKDKTWEARYSKPSTDSGYELEFYTGGFPTANKGDDRPTQWYITATFTVKYNNEELTTVTARSDNADWS